MPTDATVGESAPSSQSSSCGCTTAGQDCGCDVCKGRAVSAPSYVYALGTTAPRVPSPGIERELAQVIGRSDAKGMTDRQSLHAALSRRENRYLARRLC